MSNKSRHNKLYNYLVNQFGISKETVLEAIKIRIDELLDEQIRCAIHKYVENRAIQYYDSRIKEYIGKQIREHIEGIVDNKLKDVKLEAELQLTLTPKLEIKLEKPIEKIIRKVKEERIKGKKDV